MKITVVGVGYVGLIQAVGLAHLGHSVHCLDIDNAKIEKLKQGVAPIYEPGLDLILKAVIEKKLVHFTTDKHQSLTDADIIFVAVGTPSRQDGRAELKYVQAVVKDLVVYAKSGAIVVIKSTVPLGFNQEVQTEFKKAGKKFELVSNPEFLREGTAIEDFLNPDRVVIGASNKASGETVAALYQAFNCPVLMTDPATAELIKYASNTFLAMEISYINSVALIAEKAGADIAAVSEAMRLDQRIGAKAFLQAGIGYGGSCFPKDVKELIYMSRELGVAVPLIDEIPIVNDLMRAHVVAKLNHLLNGLQGKKIAIWGLAFKANTDDTRESASLDVIGLLQAEGATVVAYDPVVKAAPGLELELADSALSACVGADALVLTTGWPEFLAVDLTAVAKALKSKVVVDGRNFLDPKTVKLAGLRYTGVGR